MEKYKLKMDNKSKDKIEAKYQESKHELDSILKQAILNSQKMDEMARDYKAIVQNIKDMINNG